MNEIHFDDVNTSLIKEIPELTAAYEQELSWWHNGESPEEPGQHIIFGDVLVPFIFKSLDEKDEEVLKRIFDYLEKLSLSEDERIQEVVAVTVCPGLAAQNKYKKIIQTYLRPQTARLCKDMGCF